MHSVAEAVRLLNSHANTTAMLTVAEAARLLNVHVNTVRNWSNSGLLPVYRLGKRRDRRFRREDVLKLLQDEGSPDVGYQKGQVTP